ncbi:MAG: amidohydrolase family protein [Gammaproteobacteria bacterium]|nr:amidohydrolase family protein [Gammaproteobacteria bacterium]
MGITTVIENIDWLVAWSATDQRHEYVQNATIAFHDGEVTFVGHSHGYDGARDVAVNGAGRMVLPGFVNVHTHPTTETLRKGITDETQSPGFWHSSLYEHLPVFEPADDDGRRACIQVALAELLLSGVTTVVDLSAPFDGWLDALADSGIRAVAAPFFRDARWYTDDGHSLSYDWNEKAGREAFDRACHLIELARQHPSGRLDGMLSPSQIDTCTESLLRDSHAYATERNLPWTIHAAQSVTEFHEIQRRHGMSPIQWLDALGVLTERSVIAHCIFLDHHPWLHWTSKTDLGLMADSGATVAHCPNVFARRGIALNTLGEYLRAGINVGIGTDTYPHNFVEEMRLAATMARAVSGTVTDLTFSDVFHAATVGGARALGRTDIGRLEAGAKADFVSVDLSHPTMMPVREPLRSMIGVSCERAIRDVYVDGNAVVKDGALSTIDLGAASDALQRAQAKMLTLVASKDWNGRSADELAPMMLSTRAQN